MRILQVIPYFVPAWGYGGPLAVAYNLSKQLVKSGHEVTVYTTDVLAANRRIRRAAEPIDGIGVVRFRNLSSTIVHNQNIFFSPRLLSVVKRDLRDFDAIHMHEYRTIQNAVVHHYARQFGIPYVLQAHGSLTTFFYKGWLKRTFDKLWGYRILRHASKLIALTRTEAEQYRSMGVSEEKIEIVPNGIDLSEFENLPERGEFRTRYGLKDSEKIVLYLGRIHKIKGLDLLAGAFAELSRQLGDARLVIAGPDDGYLRSLKGLVADLGITGKVLFTGPLYGREKLSAYVDADVYVLPSYYEIFGITVLEACACGTPVIVTDRCGIADVINDQAGLVVPYDRDALAKAIAGVLGNDDETRELGEKGRLLVRDRFNWESIARQVEKVYADCVSVEDRAT